MPAALPPILPGRPLVGSGPEAVADPLGLYTRAQRELGDVVRFQGIAGISWYMIAHPERIEHVLRTAKRITARRSASPGRCGRSLATNWWLLRVIPGCATDV